MGASQPVHKRHHLNADNSIKYCENQLVQNFILIWLDANANKSDKDCHYTISQLRQVVNSIALFTDPNACYDLIARTKDAQIFLIVSGALGKDFVPLVHDNIRLDSIYVFCGDPTRHAWTKEWKKIALVTNQIENVCKLFAQDAAQCERDLTPTSILSMRHSSNQDLDKVDSSFLYSLLIRDIVLEMYHGTHAVKALAGFCRQSHQGNETELKNIDTFEQHYEDKTPIWWYTCESFIYKMLNRALRHVDINVINAMAFFIKQLHDQIQQWHSEHATGARSFIVYRGQRMLLDEFNGIRSNVNGLVSFNSFLSTSIRKEVALGFAKPVAYNKVAVLFEMRIDPGNIGTPFAELGSLGCYGDKEGEVLFSMHTVFRIVSVQEDPNQLWVVKVESTSKKDLQITRLTEQVRRELREDTAVERLAHLFVNLEELNKAELMYKLVLDFTRVNDEQTRARIDTQLGYVHFKQDQFNKAKLQYEKAIAVQERLRPKTDLELAVSYNNMGLLHTKLGDSSSALVYHKKALFIRERRLDAFHADLATTYNDLGLVCYNREEYADALAYYNKTLRIYEKSLPAHHSWIGTAYKNIGLAQIGLGERKIGLENLCEARRIRKLSLPAKHPSIASICSTIGDEYRYVGDYAQALPFYEEALDIEKGATNCNYPTLAEAHYNMSKTLSALDKRRDATIHAELAIKAARHSLPADHVDMVKFNQHLSTLQSASS